VPAGYQPAGYGYGYPAAPKTDGMAIASMVCSLAGLVACCIPSVVGLILGLVSLSRIKKSQGALGGRGMAITGVVVGAVLTAGMLIYAAVVLIAGASGST